MFHRIVSAALALALILALCGCAGAEQAGLGLGLPLPDFTVQTTDGSFTLSEALRDHDMVLINFWATWCGYCVLEFPHLQQAWEKYADRVAVIALSVERGDTLDVMRDFARENGLTIPMASDEGPGLGSTFATMSVPVSIVVDRFGNVAFAMTGAMPDAEHFERLFAYFTADEYTESVALDQFPPRKPQLEGVDAAELSAAANADGGELEFYNPDQWEIWPMLPVETDGRLALAASNTGMDVSTAAVAFRVDAAEGDALAFSLKTSTEACMDVLYVDVDGQTVKCFSGEHGWTDWAVPLAAGTHEIMLGYRKDHTVDAGEDCAWIDDVRLVSRGEAEALLAALPARPVGEKIDMRLISEGAREIVFDPMSKVFGDIQSASAWIVPGDSVRTVVTLPAEDDPEVAHFYSSRDRRIVKLADGLTAVGDSYEFEAALSSLETDGTDVTLLCAYPYDGEQRRLALLLLFRSEDAVNEYLEDSSITWRYADEQG